MNFAFQKKKKERSVCHADTDNGDYSDRRTDLNFFKL